MKAVLLLIYSFSVRRRFREDHKPFINTLFHDTSANCRRVFCFVNSKFPFMCHPRHVHIPFKRKPRLTYKTISTEYLQCLNLKTQKLTSTIFAVWPLRHECNVLPPVEQCGQLEADHGMGASWPVHDQNQCIVYAILILNTKLTPSLIHLAVVLCSEVIYGSCLGAERLAGSTALSVRPHWATPFAIQSTDFEKGWLAGQTFYIPFKTTDWNINTTRYHRSYERCVVKMGIFPYKLGLPYVRESGFRKPWICRFWIPESWALESGINLQESWILLTTGIRNPGHWRSTPDGIMQQNLRRSTRTMEKSSNASLSKV